MRHSSAEMYKLLWAIPLALLLILPVSTLSYEAPIKLPIKEYAELEVEKMFGEGKWSYFHYIVSKESLHWSVYTAHYPSGYTKSGIKSSAYGLCGFLNATWKGEKTNDPYVQIDECLVYVKERYGTPPRAKIHHEKF